MVFGTGFAALGAMFLLWSAGLGLGLQDGGHPGLPAGLEPSLTSAAAATRN